MIATMPLAFLTKLLEDYNEVHLHSGLRFLSARGILRLWLA